MKDNNGERKQPAPKVDIRHTIVRDPKDDTLVVFVSDAAKDRLGEIAIERRYVKPGATRLRGLSRFVAALCDTTFIDARKIIDTADEGEHPMWYPPYIRRTMIRLYISNEDIETLVDKAVALGVYMGIEYDGPYRYYIGDAREIIEHLLEAIGREWVRIQWNGKDTTE